jgi:hypothetical protein
MREKEEEESQIIFFRTVIYRYTAMEETKKQRNDEMEIPTMLRYNTYIQYNK